MYGFVVPIIAGAMNEPEGTITGGGMVGVIEEGTVDETVDDVVD